MGDPFDTFQRVAENVQAREDVDRAGGLEGCRAECEAILDRQLQLRQRLHACGAPADLITELRDGPIATSREFLQTLRDESVRQRKEEATA